MIRNLALLSFLACSSMHSFGSVTITDSASIENKDSILILSDIAEAARIDSAILCYYEDLMAITSEVYSARELAVGDSIPVFEGSVYQSRLLALDNKTPFDLTYNAIVEAFIHLYVSKKRTLSSKCLGRSDQYFPMFEATLDRYGLPLELKYLAVVESALDPKARSRAGATGLWQFMYGTGKNFGLEISSYVDERSDPEKSTEAAAKYLSYLYKMFGDWNLALAAYNCGEGRVTKAIRRSGGKKSYWDIYPFLPKETRGYVPAFIAVNYLYAHAADHGILAAPTNYFAYEVDSVHLKHQMSFKEVASILGVSEVVISDLNPAYKLNVVPGYGKHVALYLPKSSLHLWVANEERIYATIAEKVTQEPASIPEAPVVVSTQSYYTVKSGDYLGKIASTHNCSVRQIQEWNNLHSTSLKIGQKLIINGSAVSSQPTIAEANGGYVYYSIRPGDTLWEIAKAKGISIDDLKKWNSGLNINNIKPGQKIVIGKA